ncbi:MAG: hypothetical protein KDB40_00085 [Acidimicrobiales bacterium]|nr:hypothetical protein [Acidimicrobiales bacterium]
MWRPTRPADPAARAARLVTIVATVVFALIVVRCRPWDLFVREAYSNDFYDEQARSFLRLRVAVRPEIPLQEGFLVDGKTYLYYGPFLAVVRLPFAVFGDVFAGRLARLSMIAGYAAALTGSFHLVRRLAPTASVRRVGVFVAAVACSPLLFLSGWVSVYHETELWAFAFATWAFAGTVRLLDGRTPERADVLAVAFPVAAGITTRASVGLGVAAGVCVAASIAFWSRIVTPGATERDQKRAAVGAMGGVVGASALGFAIHAGLNWIKFGSPTALPGQLQVLSLNDPTRAAWFAGNGDSFFSLRFVSTTLAHYLRPDTVRFERMLPFVRFGPLATDRSSYPLETITPAASITTSATLLLVAAVIGIVVIGRRRRWTLVAMVAGGLIAAVPTFTIGFIGNRYLVDMLPMLLVPAAVAIGTCAFPIRPWRPAARRIVRIAVVALVALGAWCNAALAVWTQQLKEPGFTSWRYRVDGWVFGDPAPALVDLTPGAPVPRDGTVALDRDPTSDRCSGVYIAEQGSWVALERSNDGRRLHGVVELDDDAAALLAGGDDWTVSAAVNGTSVVVEAEVDGRSTLSAPVPLPSDHRLDVDVIADPVVGELSVTVDGDQVVFVFAGPTGAGVPGATFELDPDPGDSLCRQLEARR